jgi:hypothetical protein
LFTDLQDSNFTLLASTLSKDKEQLLKFNFTFLTTTVAVFVKSQLHNFTMLELVPTLSSTTLFQPFLAVEVAPAVTTELNHSPHFLSNVILET